MFSFFSWQISSDYFHGEELPKYPDPKILEAWKNKAEEEKTEEDEP